MKTEQVRASMDALRTGIKNMVAEAVSIKSEIQKDGPDGADVGQNKGEMLANITIAYRHLEDAAMRFGKVIQAADGGESPLGGPSTPKN